MWSGSTLQAMTLTEFSCCGLCSQQVDVDRPGIQDFPTALSTRKKLRDAVRQVTEDKNYLTDKLVLTFCLLTDFFLTGRKLPTKHRGGVQFLYFQLWAWATIQARKDRHEETKTKEKSQEDHRRRSRQQWAGRCWGWKSGWKWRPGNSRDYVFPNEMQVSETSYPRINLDSLFQFKDEESPLVRDEDDEDMFVIEQTGRDFLEVKKAEYVGYRQRAQQASELLFTPSLQIGTLGSIIPCCILRVTLSDHTVNTNLKHRMLKSKTLKRFCLSCIMFFHFPSPQYRHL